MDEKPPDQRAKALCASLGLTQERFAAKVDVTVSTVNRWENGKRTPSPLAPHRIEELWRDVRNKDSE